MEDGVTIKILHLEDDPDDSELILTELKSLASKIDFIRVDSEKDFRLQLEMNQFDIILADYNLPTFDGVSALKICSENYPEIPFIIVSGTLGEEIAVKMLKYGASDYLLKQNLKRLATAVNHSLEEAKLKKAKQRAENELIQSEEKFRSITENSADAIFVVDQTGKYVFTNKKVTEMLGFSQEEMGLKNIIDLAPPEKAEKYMSLFNQLLSLGKVTGELELLRNDDTFLPVDLNAVVLPGGFVYGSCRDISDKKLAENALKESEKKYRNIFENIQDVFYQINKDGIVTEISPSIYRLSGYTSSEIIGSSWTIFYYYPEESDLLLEKLAKDNEVWDYEVRMKTKEGIIKYTSLNAHQIYDEKGQPSGIEGSLRDIDERKQFELKLEEAKEKAEESDRLKTAFLHNVSHEIRTPMNAIIGFSSILGENEVLSDNQKSFIQSIQDSSAQLLSIINDIVDISSIEANVLKKSNSSININETLESLFIQFQLKANENGNSLILSPGLSKEESILETDKTKLIQILSNLITNALKFTKNGKVIIGYKLKENMLEFYVSDTGIGIAHDQHLRVFDNFYQVENDLSRQYGGTGLGLAISKAYVELLGGKIWLESELGKGSTFYFNLPYHKAQVPLTEEKENRVSEDLKFGIPVTILVAEDDDQNFLLITHLLANFNAEIVRASNGKEAFDMCKSEKKYDLILMDIKMPVMNGYTATELIKEIYPDLPVIAQTAFVTEKEKAMACGCDDFISKPFKKEELLTIIRKHLKEIE
jgi:PAS domain S-box-containing protein